MLPSYYYIMSKVKITLFQTISKFSSTEHNKTLIKPDAIGRSSCPIDKQYFITKFNNSSLFVGDTAYIKGYIPMLA